MKLLATFVITSILPVTIHAAGYAARMPHGTQYKNFPVIGLTCPSEDPTVNVTLSQMQDAAAEMYINKDWNNWVNLSPGLSGRKAFSPLIAERRENAVSFIVDYDRRGPTFTYRGGPAHEILDPRTNRVRVSVRHKYNHLMCFD